jgi:hypothetical protein
LEKDSWSAGKTSAPAGSWPGEILEILPTTYH